MVNNDFGSLANGRACLSFSYTLNECKYTGVIWQVLAVAAAVLHPFFTHMASDEEVYRSLLQYTILKSQKKTYSFQGKYDLKENMLV